jgi:hypothetical protein
VPVASLLSLPFALKRLPGPLPRTRFFFIPHPGAAACDRDAKEKTSQNNKPMEKNMKTNKQETTKSEITQIPQATPRTGYYQNIMPVLSRDGETVFVFLPGEMTVVEPANRFKGLLGIKYEPKAPTDRSELKTRYGFHARVRLGISQDGQWVTIYLPGNMGKVVNHVNAYNHIFGIPYEKKVKAEAKAVA